MNIRDQRKNHYISVKKLTGVWEKGGLKAVAVLLNDPRSIVERDSWVAKIKKLIEEKKILSVDAEIKLVKNIFKYQENENQGDKENNSISGRSQHIRDSRGGSDTDNNEGSENIRQERGTLSSDSIEHGSDQVEKLDQYPRRNS